MTFFDFMKLVRYKNLVIIFMTQVLVYYTLIEGRVFFIPDPVIFALIIGTVLLTAAGYVINDYYDVEADRINRQDKIVVERIIAPRKALYIWMILNILAFLFAWIAGWKFLVFFIIVAFLLYIYALKIKRTPLLGNILVSVLLAMTIVILWLYKKGDYFELMVLYAVFAFLTGLIREVLKDLEDMEGDQIAGFATFPVIFGIQKTINLVKILILALVASLIIFAIFIMYMYYHYWVMMVYLLIFVLVPASLSLYLLQNAKEKNDFEQLTRYMKFIVFMGSFSMFLLLL